MAITVCLQKPHCVSAWLLPAAAAREKPELTLQPPPQYQGSSLVLSDQSQRVLDTLIYLIKRLFFTGTKYDIMTLINHSFHHIILLF